MVMVFKNTDGAIEKVLSSEVKNVSIGGMEQLEIAPVESEGRKAEVFFLYDWILVLISRRIYTNKEVFMMKLKAFYMSLVACILALYAPNAMVCAQDEGITEIISRLTFTDQEYKKNTNYNGLKLQTAMI